MLADDNASMLAEHLDTIGEDITNKLNVFDTKALYTLELEKQSQIYLAITVLGLLMMLFSAII